MYPSGMRSDRYRRTIQGRRGKGSSCMDMGIHKAQGKTLDSVIVDISRGAFAHGQTYVALSRTRNASDMHISVPLRPRDIIFDSRVLDFVDANHEA